MDIVQAIILALIQGLTEFLPISSSGHLILPSKLLGWPDQGLAFDVAVHVGTLLAVMIYFRKMIIDMGHGVGISLRDKAWNEDAKLAMAIIVGVIPAGLVGVLFNDFIEEHLRAVSVIALTTIGFGFLLGWTDWRAGKAAHAKSIAQVGLGAALFIGAAQALALIPGTSRSGITITAALMLGFSRDAAARFSFLLSIPLILAAGSMKALELVEQAEPVNWFCMSVGTLVAGVSAYLCIHWFLQLLDRIGMMPFVVYRLILGGVLLTMV